MGNPPVQGTRRTGVAAAAAAVMEAEAHTQAPASGPGRAVAAAGERGRSLWQFVTGAAPGAATAEVEDVWGLVYAATFNPPDPHPLKGLSYVGRVVEPDESPEGLLATVRQRHEDAADAAHPKAWERKGWPADSDLANPLPDLPPARRQHAPIPAPIHESAKRSAVYVDARLTHDSRTTSRAAQRYSTAHCGAPP